MSNVNAKTANWRLFGGGGLLVGGLLWLLAWVIAEVGTAGDITVWLVRIGLIVIALGFFFVSWGETGSNGAVGNNIIGKIGLWAAAVGFLLWGLRWLFGTGMALDLMNIIFILITVGTLLAAVIIMQKGVAQGLAKWVMFLVFILALIIVIAALANVSALAGIAWTLYLIISIVLTGILYILNK